MLMHAQVIGKGRPFIILHGFLGSGDNWKSLANDFAEAGFEMHLLDQRNHGRSFHSNDFSYELMAEDLNDYLKENDLDDIVLMGHSMGGKTAMQFAVTYPGKIAKLIIADIGPKRYPQHHQDILKALSTLDFESIKSRGEADKLLSKYIEDLGTRQFLLKNLYWKEKGKLALRMNLPVLADNIEEIGKPLKEGSIFKGETLFLKGENSGYIEDFDAGLIKNHFPQSKIQTVANAGHWLHAENPSEFYRYVMDFL